MRSLAEIKPLTYRLNLAAPLDLDAYESQDGYAALRKAVKDLQPDEVTQLVKEANLRGRGGAGFPAGVKWALVPMGADAPRNKYPRRCPIRGSPHTGDISCKPPGHDAAPCRILG